jgi:hypothetical protein
MPRQRKRQYPQKPRKSALMQARKQYDYWAGTPKQREEKAAQRKKSSAPHLSFGELLAFITAVGVLPAIACWLYPRNGIEIVLGLAALSIIFWVIAIRSDLGLIHFNLREPRSLHSTVMHVAFVWLIWICAAIGIVNVFYHSIGFKSVLIVLFMPAPMWYFLVLHIKRIREDMATSSAKSDMDSLIKKALETMDSTAGSYESEDAANKELATTIKVLNSQIFVEYQPRISDGTTADIRIGNVLIEGKLEPDISEADRVIGQLRRYCRDTTYLVKVVIYGKSDHHVREHIEREIREAYNPHNPGRVTLIYLSHPHRIRSQSYVT